MLEFSNEWLVTRREACVGMNITLRGSQQQRRTNYWHTANDASGVGSFVLESDGTHRKDRVSYVARRLICHYPIRLVVGLMKDGMVKAIGLGWPPFTPPTLRE